jgi:hypothetical protein
MKGGAIMALGLGKVSAKILGVKLSDINRIADLADKASDYWSFRDNQEKIEKHYPTTTHWVTTCYNHPTNQDEIAMEMFNELLDGFGVEAIRSEGEHVDNYHFDIVATYVNMGDTYNTTVVYDTIDKRFMVTSWGDFVEYMGY